MEIDYVSKKLEKSAATPGAIKAHYGTRAKLVNMRIEELASAKNLEMMRNITKANCHELTNNLKGKLAVDISANHRIIFKPNHDPVPQKNEGGLDWSAVTRITILGIGTDYH